MEDVQGLAVPVVDRDGHAIACLTMLTPLSRAAVANEALPELKQAADGLARSLERDGL
jgi:DNA-binding IclR family transcriptional regulator